MKRISLYLVAVLAIVAIMALPAFAQYNDYGRDNDYGRYDNDRGRDNDDRYPPGYNDREEPREPRCDWYGPYEDRRWKDAWWEYWCYWPDWGWEFVFWTWA